MIFVVLFQTSNFKWSAFWLGIGILKHLAHHSTRRKSREYNVFFKKQEAKMFFYDWYLTVVENGTDSVCALYMYFMYTFTFSLFVWKTPELNFWTRFPRGFCPLLKIFLWANNSSLEIELKVMAVNFWGFNYSFILPDLRLYREIIGKKGRRTGWVSDE